jgi:hypothetical protein
MGRGPGSRQLNRFRTAFGVPGAFRRDAVNPSLGAPGAASMPRTALRNAPGTPKAAVGPLLLVVTAAFTRSLPVLIHSL